jgi:hypothetical protein
MGLTIISSTSLVESLCAAVKVSFGVVVPQRALLQSGDSLIARFARFCSTPLQHNLGVRATKTFPA